MKALDFYASGEEDYLRLSFNGVFGSRVALKSELEPFFRTLEEYADGWMPDVIKGKRQRQYARAAIWKALEERRDECRYPVTYAMAHSADDGELADFPSFGRDDETLFRDGFDKIYEVFWLNVFGPKLVETVGRERMLSTPAHRVEELPDGSVLLVTWPTAADFASREARLAQARAHAHLRPDLDFDTILRTLHERSATLAPVEPRFHPDVLVRHLGGQWIPRQKLEEAQVLVGHRVWLPFLRARRSMTSRQALLDYSLTQLYRAAERHRG